MRSERYLRSHVNLGKREPGHDGGVRESSLWSQGIFLLRLSSERKSRFVSLSRRNCPTEESFRRVKPFRSSAHPCRFLRSKAW
jgi:hypothetical protein